MARFGLLPRLLYEVFTTSVSATSGCSIACVVISMTPRYYPRRGRYDAVNKEGTIVVGGRATNWIRGIPILIALLGAVMATTISAGACGVFTSISLNPTSGQAGSVVAVSGTGFAPAPGGSVAISLGANGPVLGSVSATAFSVPVTIPSSTPPGPIVISATDHTGSVPSVTATFMVTAPSVAPSSSGSSGSSPSPPAAAPAPGQTGGLAGSGAPASSSSGGTVGGGPAGPGGTNYAIPGGDPPSGMGSAPQDFSSGDASGIPAGIALGSGSAAHVSNPLVSGAGTVFGTLRNGFTGIAEPASGLAGGTPAVQPQTGLVPVGILVATLLPVLLAAGSLLSIRRRKATRRT